MRQKTEPFALPTELQARMKLTFHILLYFFEKSIPKNKKSSAFSIFRPEQFKRKEAV
ncbi:hypothetical protein [Fournierella sp.]|uniref:hypothetical protein n=1 Tax=Allofournierella sp. TaxID=1940256 RepID=UPI00307A6A0F